MPVENWMFFIVVLLGYFWLIRYLEGYKAPIYKQIKKEVSDIFDDFQFGAEDYKFYGSGHPDFWTECTRDDFERYLQKASGHTTYAGFNVYVKPEYVYRIDNEDKEFFFAIGKKEFDFGSLKIYLGEGKNRATHS